ncbi:MAG: glycosyltransferase family 2 protein [Candidatus Neomarinimicrobiota bacterium]|jgi:glycosyltransferase involved in cell wall biosynthesis|nr:glycosyltransferase family 2 protein [Candidatus Neomarinimicrobiota bacterium]MDX9781068.1 glycosyltransferase family 2 protein [bacterium]
MDLSVIIPVYNEEGSLRELSERIMRVFEKGGYKGEIIFINDGSTDKTAEILNALDNEQMLIRSIHFHRNKGKAAALQAGFEEAKGKYVITMDGDLQDEPGEIPALIAKLEEGFDIVSGWKKKRHDPISKRWPSKLFNSVARAMSGIKIHDFNCGLKAYRREVVKQIRVYGEMHRWIPVLAKVEGFKTGEIVVTHHPRKSGKSKYGFSRTFKGFFDFMTVFFLSRFTLRPMHFFGFLGLLSVSAGTIVEIVVLIYKYGYGHSFQSHLAMLILGVLLIVLGVQLFSIGLIGEMMVYQSKKKQS